MDTIYIGLDLHKRTSKLCIKTKDGAKVAELSLKTTKEAFVAVLSAYAGAHIVFEPVSQSWWLGDILEDLGLVVYLANAREVRAIAHARVKNDRIDARVLCDLLRTGLLPESYRSSRKAREWKELVRFRASLIDMRTQVKNKVHALLSRQGIIPPYGMIFGPKGRAWLRAAPLSPVNRAHCDQYLSLLDAYEAAIAAATMRVNEAAVTTAEATLLMSIPGVSHVSALSIMAEIDDIKRFQNGKQVASYAGLVPSVYSSGESVRHGRLTKRGSKSLRTILIEAAHRQGRLKRSRGLRPYHERVAASKGIRTATVATARKLCVVIYSLLASKQPFDDARLVA